MPRKLSDLAVIDPTSGTDVIYLERSQIGYRTEIRFISGISGDRNNVFNNIYVLQTGFINKVLGGDYDNNAATGAYSAVAGGTNCKASGIRSFIGAGRNNRSANNADQFIGGGSANMTSGDMSTVCGGNSNSGMATMSFVGGGRINFVFSSTAAIVGGDSNEVPLSTSDNAFIGAGEFNKVRGLDASMVGGNTNYLSGNHSFLGGGDRNVLRGTTNVVAGGQQNDLSGIASVIGGGTVNRLSGNYSCIPGGRSGIASGDYSIAFGLQSLVKNNGAGVFGDSRAVDKNDNGADTFTFHYQNGIFVSGKDSALHRTFGSVVVGSGLITASAHGFLYLPTVAGNMVSTPFNHGSLAPMSFNTTDNTLQVYNTVTSAWKIIPKVGGGVSPASQTVGAGTNYTLTNTYALVDFGTTDPVVTLDEVGTWLLMGNALVSGGGNTVDVSLKLRNSTDSVDLAGSDAKAYWTTPDIRTVPISAIYTISAQPKTIQLWAMSDQSVAVFPVIQSTHTKLMRIKLNDSTS